MVYNDKHEPVGLIGKIYITILLVIFAGIVIHAPISVGFGVLWPNHSLIIKSWKEILMLVAGLLALFLMYKNRRFRILRDPVIIAIAVYATLHLALLFYQPTGLASSLAGLVIDLRYVLYFSLVYIAVVLFPNSRRLFIKTAIIGALVFTVFALMQVFILPKDFLKYVGYSRDTIVPYMTVDQNGDFIRINSTLRGPNPVGAYAAIILTLVMAAGFKKIIKDKWQIATVAILGIGGLVALWASYSRSALIGFFAAIMFTLFGVKDNKKIFKNKLIITGSVVLCIIGVLFVVGNPEFISNVFMHKNPIGDNSLNSNEGHLQSLQDGIDWMIHQPFGAGVGSTGSASLFGDEPVIIENQYLLIAHEAGWLGLGLFIFIFGFILAGLRKRRDDWLAFGVIASGVGMALIGLLLPVWVDDTVAIVWWGLAGVVTANNSYIVDTRDEGKL